MAKVAAAWLLAGLLMACLPGPAIAQATLAERALAAEGERRWDDALALYRTLLAQEPAHPEVWARMATIHASQDRPREALAAIQSALALRPDDVDYLRTAGALASWSGDYGAAREYYEKLSMQTGDPELRLQLGRVTAWGGDTDAAAKTLRAYVEARPDSADGWLELARAHTWRGDAHDALNALDEYRRRFGDSPEAQHVRARALMVAGRPTAAAELLQPLVAQAPSAVDLRVSATLADTQREDARRAFDGLAALTSLAPTSPDTRQTHDIVRASLGSLVEPRLAVYSDSDQLEIAQTAVSGSWALTSGTRLSGGYEYGRYQAPASSGLGLADGSAVTRQLLWAGIAQPIGTATLTATLGEALALDREEPEYSVGIRWRASDTFSARIGHDRTLMAVSPRTLDLGLIQTAERLQILWSPSLRWLVALDGSSRRLSDDNDGWTASVAPQFGLVRSAHLNLDVGGSAYLLATSLDLSNGYYDPQKYENYAATIQPYVKLNDNAGISVFLAVGAQRESGESFRPGVNAAADAVFGIYRAWRFSARVSATQNQRLASGAFGGFSGALTLARRF
jgi:cytochrome c-type biogenesis protein CcmH/NrfG